MYDPVAALNNAQNLMGLELKPCGPNKLCGGYYLDGSRHQFRTDKMKVFISHGSVWVAEEGGRCISLPQWLIEFGQCADFKDALRVIKGESQVLNWHRDSVHVGNEHVKYVSPDVLEAARNYPLEKCPLFVWMCSLFPEKRVRETWERYNVTTDAHRNAVFWYVNQDGKILFDKRIAYNNDGHRNRSFFPGRQFRVGDGYSEKCFFGACIPDDGKTAFVCESEKTVLLASLYYNGRRFLATGGKNNLSGVEPNMLLVPDMDGRIEWEEKGEVWPWWEKCGMPVERIPEHADLGDIIVWKIASGK